MKNLLKIVFTFLFCVTNIFTALASPSYMETADKTLMIHCNALGDILSLDFDMTRSYKKVVVSGGPLGLLDLAALKWHVENCTFVDLTNAQLQSNAIIPQSFTDLQCLEEFRAPKSVEWIRSGSFNNCPNLKTVILPKALKEIDCATFQNCPKLKLKIPLNVTVGKNSFNVSKITRTFPFKNDASSELLCRLCPRLLNLMDKKNKYDKNI